MADPPPARRAHMNDTEEGLREEEVIEREDKNVVIPADRHGWKKYGQKFIKNIGKTRSYFKCHEKNCKAKKRAEWSSLNPKDTRIIYEGAHNHSFPTPRQASSPTEEEASASRVSQYDLYTQVFGGQNNSNS